MLNNFPLTAFTLTSSGEHKPNAFQKEKRFCYLCVIQSMNLLPHSRCLFVDVLFMVFQLCVNITDSERAT